MSNQLPDRVRREICRFARQNGVRKVILFGSRARGLHTDRSDIDLAVTGGCFEAFEMDIREKTHSLLMFDVVDLDAGVSEALKEEIERDGIVIYEEA